MVREFCVPPLGCMRVAGSLLTMIERMPSASRLIATFMPTGPPPTMITGAEFSAVEEGDKSLMVLRAE